MWAGDEDEAVVLGGEGGEEVIELIERLLAHAAILSFIARAWYTGYS
jgi:hypothetical protein